MRKILLSVLILLSVTPLAVADYPKTREERRNEKIGSLLGKGGLQLNFNNKNQAQAINCKINPILWQASLEVLELLPLVSTDYMAGIVITDWYSSKEDPNYKFKIQVMITGEELALTNINVIVHKKIRHGNGWIIEPGSDDIKSRIEDKIIRNAREINLKQQK